MWFAFLTVVKMSQQCCKSPKLRSSAKCLLSFLILIGAEADWAMMNFLVMQMTLNAFAGMNSRSVFRVEKGVESRKRV